MLLLRERLPTESELWVARSKSGNLIAGCWILFHRPDVVHTQYIASAHEGRSTQAADLLVGSVVEAAVNRGARYLTFGSSTADGGRTVNTGLLAFKTAFGAGTISVWTFDVSLGTAVDALRRWSNGGL